MQRSLKRNVLAYSSWALAGYGYLLAALPWFISKDGFFFSQIITVSCFAGATFMYSLTSEYDKMMLTGDWYMRQKQPMMSGMSVLTIIATIAFMVLFAVEKAKGSTGYLGRSGALFALELFWFGRLIAKR